MLTLTTSAHLASVRARLATTLTDQQYNDLAVIAIHYSMHAKTSEDRLDASGLYVEIVQRAADARRMARNSIQ